MADEKKDEQVVGDGKEKEAKGSEGKEYTKEQQALDQERANLKKKQEELQQVATERNELRESLGTLADAIEQTNTSLEELRSQIKTDAGVKQVDDDADIDAELVDPKLLKAFRGQIKRVKELEGKFAESEKKIKDLETTKDALLREQLTTREETAKSLRREKILSKLDKKFGAKYRNDAITLANKKVDEMAENERPQDAGDATLLISECYEEVAGKDKKEAPKKSASTDTGEGEVIIDRSEIGEGTLDEILPKIAGKFKGKKITMPGVDGDWS